MIDRRLYTPNGDNPPCAVPINPYCTVPTEEMATILADLLNTDGDVLEVGTGSGYQTAILAERCNFVVSVEIQQQLSLQYPLPKNTALIFANGLYFDTGSIYDAVLVTFAIENIMPVWIKQLKIGGRLVLPLRIGDSCQIRVYEKVNDTQVRLVDAPAYANFTEAVTEEKQWQNQTQMPSWDLVDDLPPLNKS